MGYVLHSVASVAHRDYNLRGAVHVRLNENILTISNPGGFVEGVTLNNLLTTEPRPRNPGLADALKRIGLVERTGRSYTLSPEMYRMLGQKVEYTRQAGFDQLQNEQLIQNFVVQHGSIARQDVIDLCRLTPDQAYKLLKRLCDKKILLKQGDRKASKYVKA